MKNNVTSQRASISFEGTLFFGKERGYYVVLRGRDERPVFAGTKMAINMAGQWIAGRVEHREHLYACKDAGGGVFGGYFFVAKDGGCCGLCAGMAVRAESEQ